MSIMFSIITPCYRGKDFLPRVYSSLIQKAKTHHFEWIIVDDFSNDYGETQKEIDKIKKKSQFPVNSIYLKKNYYGSRSAYTGSIHAKGEYSIILDQDDMLSENALDIFYEKILEYGSILNFAGVCGRCNDTDGRLVGTKFPWKEKLSNEIHIRHIDKIRGEMFQCTKTKLIEEYFCGMKPGYTNGWAWSRIAKKYQFLYTDKIVRIYDMVNPESTSNQKKLVYLDAQFEQSTEFMVDNANYLSHDRASCILMLIQWARIGLLLQKEYIELVEFVPRNIRGLFYLAFPVASIKARRDKIVE